VFRDEQIKNLVIIVILKNSPPTVDSNANKGADAEAREEVNQCQGFLSVRNEREQGPPATVHSMASLDCI